VDCPLLLFFLNIALPTPMTRKHASRAELFRKGAGRRIEFNSSALEACFLVMVVGSAIFKKKRSSGQSTPT
jgi:hypothetical protein